MAILKSVVDVNNGNTGWTRQNVLDALETTFANLGWNGGDAINGSPVAIVAPNGTESATANNDKFQYCGGPAPSFYPYKTRYFYVTNNDTTSYNFLEEFRADAYDVANNIVYINRHGLQTGDPLVYNPNNISTSFGNFVGYTTGQTYYAIRVDSGTIKLALTAEDATNNIAVDLTNVTGNWNAYSSFRRASNVLYNNYTIDVEGGDLLNFTIADTTSGGNFFLIDSPTTGYAVNRVLNTTNHSDTGYTVWPTNNGSGASGNVVWDTKGWWQTETENGNPQDTNPNRPGEIRRYGYGNSTNPAMRGEIRILPSYTTNSYVAYGYYYKYTVPASGSRSELKLRVTRRAYQYNSDRGLILNIRITSVGSGWQAGDTFTIPGSAIGGVDGTNDILVGVNSLTTAQQTARTGVCSLLVTNYGAGSNMYQKSGSGHFAVLKNINDAAKTYGTTYYGFGMDPTNPYRMYISSGMSWQTLNRRGTNHSSSNVNREYGFYYGEPGLDYAESYNYINASTDTSFSYIDFASTSTPTAYPLAIRIYKAQQPQDSNFAVIQFTQTINNVIIPFATFSLHKGPLVGANVWDLNHVWNGAYNNYYPTTRGITIQSKISAYKYYYYSSNDDSQEEIPTANTVAREANYGYFRNSNSDSAFLTSTYECNIDTYNSATNILTYYRNATYDKFYYNDALVNVADRTKSVSASANYYKPMKGLPISHNMMPCPYYLPDDYVMLQVATSPGLTEFRPGDTVTVAAGEVYEIILAGYQILQNGLDNVASNQSMGMLFCARTT